MGNSDNSTRILVGLGSCGIAAGAQQIYDLLNEKFSSSAQCTAHSAQCATNVAPNVPDRHNNDNQTQLNKNNNYALSTMHCALKIEPAGCLGLCYLEPVVTIIKDNKFFLYVNVDSDFVIELQKQIETNNSDIDKYLISDKDKALLEKYPRIALRNCGKINPENINDYNYNAQCTSFNAQLLLEEIEKSGLRGRGGAGFPTATKWRALKNQPVSVGDKKYIICNADEGDPGAFMDRSILEGDPHSILEGMIIAGIATGATEGIIYVRAEYPLAIKRLEIAIEQAKQKGLLKNNNSPHSSFASFSIRVKAGAGAFVCGEETALIASLEGERGEPRLKPPFPFEKGYFESPSIINNVETLAMIPWIINNGGAAFASIGVPGATGTKVFALTGKVKNGGLVEVPLGVTIAEVVNEFGGGSKSGKEIIAVQLGGPSGGSVPAALFNTPITYNDLAATGAIMGSGGMVVMDEDACMVDMARFFLDFTVKESCGKCVSCRVGTKRMLEILERIANGKGEPGDNEKLLQLAENIKAGALCGLGQTAPNPVLTALRYFKEEFTTHIENKNCRACVCKNLARYTIEPKKCIGCTLCALKCPTKAIIGQRKQPHTILQDKCTKCGICKSLCKFGAVVS